MTGCYTGRCDGQQSGERSNKQGGFGAFHWKANQRPTEKEGQGRGTSKVQVGEPSPKGPTDYFLHPWCFRGLLDALPHPGARRRLLFNSSLYQRAPLHVLLLPLLRQQPDEPVLLRTGQSAVQKDLYAYPAWWLARHLIPTGRLYASKRLTSSCHHQPICSFNATFTLDSRNRDWENLPWSDRRKMKPFPSQRWNRFITTCIQIAYWSSLPGIPLCLKTTSPYVPYMIDCWWIIELLYVVIQLGTSLFCGIKMRGEKNKNKSTVYIYIYTTDCYPLPPSSPPRNVNLTRSFGSINVQHGMYKRDVTCYIRMAETKKKAWLLRLSCGESCLCSLFLVCIKHVNRGGQPKWSNTSWVEFTRHSNPLASFQFKRKFNPSQ